MKKHISLLFCFLACIQFAQALPADTIYQTRPDTLKIELRTFDTQALNDFRLDADYRYGRPQEGMSPWERFMIWLGMILQQFFYYTTQTLLGQLLFYGFLIAVILWMILKLLNIEVKDLFYRTASTSKIDFQLAEENIHELDFEMLINQAVEKGEYRDAVRLVFLYALKKLSDANLIRWQTGKTNDEYIAELQQHLALPRLRELRYYFDYAWYGHFEINQQTYEGVKKTFQEFNSQIE